jgi:hypothetical protein
LFCFCFAFAFVLLLCVLANIYSYVETSAKNGKFLDDLFVKTCYSVLVDPGKMEQKKGPALIAAQKLAQLEEMRRQSKVTANLRFVIFSFVSRHAASDGLANDSSKVCKSGECELAGGASKNGVSVHDRGEDRKNRVRFDGCFG